MTLSKHVANVIINKKSDTVDMYPSSHLTNDIAVFKLKLMIEDIESYLEECFIHSYTDHTITVVNSNSEYPEIITPYISFNFVDELLNKPEIIEEINQQLLMKSCVKWLNIKDVAILPNDVYLLEYPSVQINQNEECIVFNHNIGLLWKIEFSTGDIFTYIDS